LEVHERHRQQRLSLSTHGSGTRKNPG
jgi:hypothetical protein